MSKLSQRLSLCLSASVPESLQGHASAQVQLSLISALTRAVLYEGGTLIFGGHPSITPLLHSVKRELPDRGELQVFQSEFFRDNVLPEILDEELVKSVRWTPKHTDAAASLLDMRQKMVKEATSAVFAGGKTQGFHGTRPGIVEEYELFVKEHPTGPVYLIGMLNGATRALIDQLQGREPNGLSELDRECLHHSDDVDLVVGVIVADLRRLHQLTIDTHKYGCEVSPSGCASGPPNERPQEVSLHEAPLRPFDFERIRSQTLTITSTLIPMKTQTASASVTKKMAFDFDGLIQLLAGHLYSEKKVFIRELIQNAHDAIQRRLAEDPAFQDRDSGHIDIITDLSSSTGRIIFRDNGVGMTQDDLENFLSTIGRSGTREARDEAAKTQHQLSDVIGQFGIGFLSGFVVGSKVEVHTRHWAAGTRDGCLWVNGEKDNYSISPVSPEDFKKRTSYDTGTEVVVHLASAEHRGLLHDDAVKKVIRDYADMLRIAIHVNDPGHRLPPVNTRIMPWERPDSREVEQRLDAMVYLERVVPDSVLEAIPIRINEAATEGQSALHAEGYLYVTRTRVFGRDTPRVVRVFLKRMFLCEDAKELLPPWASFVNGIINSRSLSPNAARDNFTRDETFSRLRDRLGDLIVSHFEQLREKEPQRLSEILAYHDLGIKAACHYYEPFFHKFGHLLEWRINVNAQSDVQRSIARGRRLRSDTLDANYAWATLPEVLALLPEAQNGGPKRLPCFSTASAANQYFEMADAARTVVLDASSPFEAELIRSWADKNRDRVTLVYVDREDDPAVFRSIDESSDQHVVRLARAMSGYIRPGGTGRLHVETRRFEPSTLPAVLKDNQVGSSVMKAQAILNDPNTPSDLRIVAEDMLRMSRNSDMRMNINANNDLIRTLASLVVDDVRGEDDDLNDLMLCVYNDAILYNTEMMTPSNAKLFHRQFQRLMTRSLEFVRQKTDLAEREARVQAQTPRNRPERERKVGFYMTPFGPEFDSIRDAMKEAVEQTLGCELRTADQRTFADLISGNVRHHIENADFFVADVTGQNPNVMLELGAVLHGAPDAPVLIICRVAEARAKPDLSADLQGRITSTYLLGAEQTKTVEHLIREFDKNERFTRLLPPEKREKAMTKEDLQRILGQQEAVKLPDDIVARLVTALPTRRAWQRAGSAAVSESMGSYASLAPFVLEHVRGKLNS